MTAPLTIEMMRSLAKSRNGECLSSSYINNRSKINWRCKEGHIWASKPHLVIRGSWCPKCAYKKNAAARRKYTLDDIKALAAERGGKCLSHLYINLLENMHWRCSEGHEWETAANSILQGSWCLRCKRIERGRLRRTIVI